MDAERGSVGWDNEGVLPQVVAQPTPFEYSGQNSHFGRLGRDR